MRRSWRVMSAVALVLSAASILLSVYLFDRVQANRLETVVTLCQEEDKTRAEIRRVLRRNAQSVRGFEDRNCRAYARQVVDPPGEVARP